MDVYQRLGLDSGLQSDEVIVLTQEQRDKGRLKAISDSGTEVRVFLERGKPLQVGEILKTECGKHIQVQGAVEPVTRAECDDWHTFSRACYHLGNRHVKLQVGDRWLQMTPDHVLEDMLKMLGLTVSHVDAVFVPESGAYSHGHHHH
ncbi:urease accessory protein UreE [Aestuariicella sp. G3-2]|uniref:urease accessory protein UreE n=1 Tax=Pseudomaricurvus albidus TaxID=2842452 RepID=UPI001C0BA8C6|nr:urease accessory protein UreE [Aestuariicella albida]MBU3068962.1 urease accessory protein UreE [Aestuariicella albida]